MTYVNFINSQYHYCVFNRTELTGTNFTNSSLDGSDFRQSNVTYEQLIVARSLRDIILPNGTIFQSMKKKKSLINTFFSSNVIIILLFLSQNFVKYSYLLLTGWKKISDSLTME